MTPKNYATVNTIFKTRRLISLKRKIKSIWTKKTRIPFLLGLSTLTLSDNLFWGAPPPPPANTTLELVVLGINA